MKAVPIKSWKEVCDAEAETLRKRYQSFKW